MIYKEHYINDSVYMLDGKPRWFIMDVKQDLYLHKDKTFDVFCGHEGFWDSKEEAKTFIDNLDTGNENNEVFLTEEEMMLC